MAVGDFISLRGQPINLLQVEYSTKGHHYFFRIHSYTSQGSGSLKKYYPIYQYYEKINDDNNTVRPVEKYASKLFWFPNGMPDPENGYWPAPEYTAGAENSPVKNSKGPKPKPETVRDQYRISTTPSSASQFRRVEEALTLDFNYGDTKVFAGKQYRTTAKTVSWEVLKSYDPSKMLSNPYRSPNIQLWTLLPTDEQYDYVNSLGFIIIRHFWWHPIHEKFYPVPDSLNIGQVARVSARSATAVVEYVVDNILGYPAPSMRVGSEGFVQALTNGALGLIPAGQIGFAESIRVAIVQYLVSKGISPESAANLVKEAYEYRNITVGGAKGKSGGRKDNGNSPQSPSRTVTVRNPLLGNRIEPGFGATVSLPQIVQQYRTAPNNTPITRRHIFKFPPNQIQYGNIGSEWVDIERAGNIPLVDWKQYKLLQVSFSFLLAYDDDGRFTTIQNRPEITFSIDDQIRNLREIASAPYPVYLLGFDDMMKNQVRFPFTGGRGVEFVVTDFSISSLYRTTEGSINRAQCDITLREIPIETVSLIDFPLLRFPGDKPKPDEELKEENSEPRYSETSNYFRQAGAAAIAATTIGTSPGATMDGS